MITVNLFGDSDAHVSSRVLGGEHGPARAMADALTDTARELEAAEALVR